MSLVSSQSTRALAGWIAEVNYDHLPRDVVDRAKLCILDWIGSAYAGKGSPSDRILLRLIKEMAGRRVATLVGAKRSAPPTQAALYNGTISAVMEVDDTHGEGIIHPSIGIIPAALAMAESAGSSGKDLITSVVIGYDISARVGRAAGSTHYQQWHTTGTCNTFGAAAAAGRLIGLDPEKMTMALGLAGTQAAGLWESLNDEATMAKHLHSGKAAANGVLAALLARDGFKGSSRILEGEKGFIASASQASPEDLVRMTQAFGHPFLILGNFFKQYACCASCFEAMEGVAQIATSNHLTSDDIEKIIVTMRPLRTWMVGNEDPKSIFEAKFSQPFGIALILLKGRAGLFEFSEENLYDPRVREVMRKVKLVTDPDIAVKARVEVVCKSGPTFKAEAIRRQMSSEEVKEKFVRNMTPILGEKHLHDIINRTEKLDRIEKITDFTAILK